MRKQLMVGTALAAATMLVAGGALAADKKMMKPSITVNGYYEGVVGGIVDDSQETKYSYTAMDTDGSGNPATDGITDGADLKKPASMSNKVGTSALDTRTDAEIHFNGHATLDNGLKLHARVEYEGQTGHAPGNTSDFIDEYFLSVSGGFGQIVLGGTGGAPVRMLTGLSGSWATGVGETLNFDNAWIPTAHAGPRHYNLQHSRLDTGDAEKITYISPMLGGFQVGVTYSPNRVNDDDNSRVNADTSHHDGIEGAVSYSGKFGDVGFAIGAGMTSYQAANKTGVSCDIGAVKLDVDEDSTADELVAQAAEACTPYDTTDKSDWLIASRIDFGGGFRLSVAHKRVTDDKKANRSSLTDVGVRFVQGANSFSLVGSHGEMKESEAQHTAVMASYARSLGPGVTWHANLIWNSTKSDKSTSLIAADDGMAPDTVDTDNDPNFGKPSEDHYVRSAQKENSGIALVTGLKVVF